MEKILKKFGNTQKLAEEIVKKFNMPKAEKYDLSYRNFDDMIEVIGYIDDPNFDVDYYGEVEHYKTWITLGVIPASLEVNKVWSN